MPRFIRIIFNKFKEYIVLVLLLVSSLVLITLNNNSDVKNVRLFALGVFASVNSAIINFGHIFEDTEYIENLENRNAELMLQVNQLRNFALENKELNNILQFKNTTNYDLATAKIVSRLVSKISGYFIISKGKSDGITQGMPVITDKGLVGIVTATADNYSTVRTYENSLFRVAVKVQRSNVDGILSWDGINLLVKNVPTTEDVEIGDRIVVSELSSMLPPSIPVGIVGEKESTISGVLTNLKIKPFVEIGSMKNVTVLKVTKNFQLDSLEQKLTGGLK
jgi:rod shape-determining protein MreC